MAKLLAFFPCGKVVIDRTDNNVSVSDILQEISAAVPKELMPVPVKAIVPSSWTVFSMWYRDADIQSAPFDVQSRVIAPDGSTLLDALPSSHVTFDNNTKTSQRVINLLQGFPIGAPGVCHVLLMTKAEGESDFHEVARYPILVKHIALEEVQSSLTSPT